MRTQWGRGLAVTPRGTSRTTIPKAPWTLLEEAGTWDDALGHIWKEGWPQENVLKSRLACPRAQREHVTGREGNLHSPDPAPSQTTPPRSSMTWSCLPAADRNFRPNDVGFRFKQPTGETTQTQAGISPVISDKPSVLSKPTVTL